MAPATLPPGFAETRITTGLTSPTAMELAPDGRIFVAEQSGRLRVVKDGSLLPTPFLTVNVNASGERGLLGVAFDPNFASNQFVYVYYTTASAPLHNRLSRFTANGDVAVPGSEVVLLELDNLSTATNHNGGAIHFGLDGKLYIAVGDNAFGANAQSLNTLHGKILRLNKDGTIPGDNPFLALTTGKNQAIWALGLRNPFTFDVQPGTGRIFLNDVGQGQWEEINDGGAGSNYGWPETEGPTGDPRFRGPLFAYEHGAGDERGCAIAGGAFYNPATNVFPAEYTGDYFFADFCNSWIRRYDPATGAVTGFATGITPFTVDLKVGPAGGLYYLSRSFEASGGSVYLVEFAGLGSAPMITQHPADRLVSAGFPVTFTVAASGDEPLTYQWQRNGEDIPGATATSYTIDAVALADSGSRFRALVSNGFGSVFSNEAILTVTTSRPPTATITTPPEGTTYRAGEIVAFAGAGTDPEDGLLPAAAFTWRIDFHHNDHVHPFSLPDTGSTSDAFLIPQTGETAADVFYRIYLTVRDSVGLTDTVFRDVNPVTSTFTLATEPAGLRVRLDGQPVRTPAPILGVVGILRNLGVESSQQLDGVLYEFVGWSDGGAMIHNIVTPENDTTYTAVFRVATFPDDNALFLARTYHDLLDRGPDATGQAIFGPPLEAARFQVLGPVAASYVASDENRGNFVRGLYAAHLGRLAGPAEVSLWVQGMQQGLTPEQVLVAVVGSAEHFQRQDNNTSAWLDQVYQEFFGRARDPGSQGFLDALNRGVPREQVVALIASSTEYRGSVVRETYSRFLQRGAGPSEIALWQSLLGQPAEPGRPSPREQFVAAVLGSEEYFRQNGATNGNWLDSLYARLLQRPADGPGFATTLTFVTGAFEAQRRATALTIATSNEARRRLVAEGYLRYLGRSASPGEIDYWVGVLGQGATNEQVLGAFVSSEEYFQRQGGTNGQWLDQVYLDFLGRARDASETAFLTALDNRSLSRSQVAAAVLESLEYRSRFIQTLYGNYLRRPGAAGEVDFWVQVLRQGATVEVVRAAFLSSGEYYLRPQPAA